MIITSKKDFQLYVRECEKWIKFWGLSEWDINYSNVSTDPDKVLGWCSWDLSGMIVTINLEKKWNNITLTKEEKEECIRTTAFHEVCELLLAKLNDISFKYDVPRRVMTHHSHEIISRMQNSVYKNLKNKI
ncbi:hypothetical protein M0R19_08555 [Candidatus Pacearchaeota archaeon]|jgi:hypothetical protein|nr:hypothetical protein [bacterium]MCK9597208.1 hypothetical protein [Candidatus Pacearchaeota archaeon]